MKIKMTRELIEKLPKTDLHVHLDGSVRINTLIELAHSAAPLERLAVMHSYYPQGGQRLAEALSGIVPTAEIPVVDATPVIGVHVGPNALGIAVLRQA